VNDDAVYRNILGYTRFGRRNHSLVLDILNMKSLSDGRVEILRCGTQLGVIIWSSGHSLGLVVGSL